MNVAAVVPAGAVGDLLKPLLDQSGDARGPPGPMTSRDRAGLVRGSLLLAARPDEVENLDHHPLTVDVQRYLVGRVG
jgi:hypothetical protein